MINKYLVIALLALGQGGQAQSGSAPTPHRNEIPSALVFQFPPPDDLEITVTLPLYIEYAARSIASSSEPYLGSTNEVAIVSLKCTYGDRKESIPLLFSGPWRHGGGNEFLAVGDPPRTPSQAMRLIVDLFVWRLRDMLPPPGGVPVTEPVGRVWSSDLRSIRQYGDKDLELAVWQALLDQAIDKPLQEMDFDEKRKVFASKLELAKLRRDRGEFEEAQDLLTSLITDFGSDATPDPRFGFELGFWVQSVTKKNLIELYLKQGACDSVRRELARLREMWDRPEILQICETNSRVNGMRQHTIVDFIPKRAAQCEREQDCGSVNEDPVEVPEADATRAPSNILSQIGNPEECETVGNSPIIADSPVGDTEEHAQGGPCCGTTKSGGTGTTAHGSSCSTESHSASNGAASVKVGCSSEPPASIAAPTARACTCGADKTTASASGE